ncbi:outer membrane protein [Gilliamella sp. BG1]|uniref:outer membrane protein n=1 Tax=Gilliamella sp. BG1 TaxID=3351508 RepID=UPI0039876A23
MKKSFITIAFLTSISSFSYAETSGLYINGQIGASWLKAKSIEHHFNEDDINSSHLRFGSQNKTVLSGGVGIGYNFKPQFSIPIRTELMFTKRGNLNKNTNLRNVSYIDDDGDAQTANYYLRIKTRMNTLMLNTYYDIDTGTDFTPYASLGVGTAFLKYERTGLVKGGDNEDADTDSKSKTRFAYSAGIGASYKITDNWSTDLQARYTYGGKVSVSTNDNSSNSSLKLSTTDLTIGVRYSF